MKEFWSYWKCFREHYFCGFPNLCCWKALETDIQATLMDRGWSPLFYGFPKPKALSVFLSYGPPPGTPWILVSCLLISQTRSPPWFTEEVPAQQYLEIDEVKTDSFRVTWHPLSAEEGQHKLMWIPVYGGKTQEVSWPRSKNWTEHVPWEWMPTALPRLVFILQGMALGIS